MTTCERCGGDGWVCQNCAEPEAACECADELDFDEAAPDLRRCRCNPYTPRGGP